MQDFRDLVVWRAAHRLTLETYAVTRGFPGSEQYGLTSQMRRTAVSIPANIAEGCGRGTGGDFARFLQIAMGSASELEYHIVLARDLEFIPSESADRLIDDVTQVKRMLASLIPKVRSSSPKRAPKH